MAIAAWWRVSVPPAIAAATQYQAAAQSAVASRPARARLVTAARSPAPARAARLNTASSQVGETITQAAAARRTPAPHQASWRWDGGMSTDIAPWAVPRAMSDAV